IRRVPILKDFCDSIDTGERTPGLVASVARLHPIKGFDLAIAAFAQVAKKVPEARYVVVGEGDLRPDRDLMSGDEHRDPAVDPHREQARDRCGTDDEQDRQPDHGWAAPASGGHRSWHGASRPGRSRRDPRA
ncbi:MAG TPA: glycosyltransferase, partial [Dermatophilaceae bacterium]|nr:glycosyltransferase [Dermatophilaceae bacterium]